MTALDFDKAVTALCAWREARGEGIDGIRAVVHVIANRAKAQKRTWSQIVYAHLQFSSMSYGADPQLCKVPEIGDAAFETCMSVVDAVAAGTDDDLTLGAQFYFADSIPAPGWSWKMTETVKIGHQTFFKA